jgi:hypothetical protein
MKEKLAAIDECISEWLNGHRYGDCALCRYVQARYPTKHCAGCLVTQALHATDWWIQPCDSWLHDDPEDAITGLCFLRAMVEAGDV